MCAPSRGPAAARGPTRRLGFGLASKSDLGREQPIHRSGVGGAAGAPENKVRV